MPEGNAGTTALTFTVSLSQESPDPVSVDFTTADGSAAAGSDYTAAAGTLTFAPGETVKTVDVNVLGDTANEEDERFTVTLAHPTGAVLGRAEGTGTLVNDDSLPALSTGDATQAEANGGLTAFTFTVSLSAASARVVTVDYATADDTAIGLGDDYVSAAGTVRFAPGQTSRAITVYVCGDRAHEPDEMFTVALADPMNASLADAEGIGTITNDDAVPSLSVADAVTDEGNSGTGFLHFTVTLSAPSSAAVQVAFATSPGSAGAADFTAAAGALVFSPGEVSRQFHVDILGDTTDEYDERFVVTLSDPVNATIAQARAVGCILNDDDAPTLSAGDVTAAEGDVGNKVASLTVSLSAASSKVVVVDYSCGDTTAVAGSDYAPVAGTLRFAAGQTSRTVNLIYKGDSVREGNEMFRLILSNPVHSTIARGTGIATITCDDSIEAAVGLTVQAADAAVGKTFAATVRAADGAGNTDISFNATVSLALKSGPAGATLAGVTTTHAVAGIARFSALLLMKPGTYVLAATGGGFSADSNSFTVSAGVPARLAFAQPPTNGIAGQALAPIQVALTDNWGNVHPDAGAEVTLQLQNNPGSANLLGTTTVATVNGIATFTNVAVSAPASGLTLRAMASSLRWVTSAPFTISPAGPKKVAFLTQPSNAVANAVIAPPVRVAVQDALGNTLTTATSPVTILLYANPAGARLLGTRTVNAVEGIATFADLKVDRAAAGLRLRASGTGLSGADSTVFEVRALP